MDDPLDVASTSTGTNTPASPCRRGGCTLACPCTEGGPCLCAASRDRTRLSATKCALALALVGTVGSFMMLKPDPAGVRAGDLVESRVPEDQLRAVVLGSMQRATDEEVAPQGPALHEAPQSGAEQGQWRSIGTLVGSELSVQIEAWDTSFVYTVTDASGSVLATRVTREELQSLLPHLDVDSLTASPELPRLMLADDRSDH